MRSFIFTRNFWDRCSPGDKAKSSWRRSRYFIHRYTWSFSWHLFPSRFAKQHEIFSFYDVLSNLKAHKLLFHSFWPSDKCLSNQGFELTLIDIPSKIYHSYGVKFFVCYSKCKLFHSLYMCKYFKIRPDRFVFMHSNVLLSCGAVYQALLSRSIFRVCGWNPPSKSYRVVIFYGAVGYAVIEGSSLWIYGWNF